MKKSKSGVLQTVFSLHNELIAGLKWCGLLVDYCDVFISCLDSHSDGTHSLQRIHWWASEVMLNFSISVLLKKLIYILNSLRMSKFWANFSLSHIHPLLLRAVMGNDRLSLGQWQHHQLHTYTSALEWKDKQDLSCFFGSPFFVKIYICIYSFSRCFYPQRHKKEGKQVIYHKGAENISNGARVDFKSKSEKH